MIDRIKESPIVVYVGSFGLGIVAASGFYLKAYIPMTTASLQLKVEEARPVQADLEGAKKTIATLRKEVDGLKLQLGAGYKNLPFTKSFVYPDGLEAIVVGSPFSTARISGTYTIVNTARDQESRPTTFWVQTGHPIFKTAIVFASNYDKKGEAIVRAVVFESPGDSAARLKLKNHFNQVFGPADISRDGPDIWRTQNEIVVVDIGALRVVHPSEMPWIKKRATRERLKGSQ